MSEQTKRVRFQSPRFLSEPARLAKRAGLVPPIQVAEEAVRDIRDSVRKNLAEHYSSSDSSDGHEPHNNDNSVLDRPSRVTVKRNYSPISVDIICSSRERK